MHATGAFYLFTEQGVRGREPAVHGEHEQLAQFVHRIPPVDIRDCQLDSKDV